MGCLHAQVRSVVVWATCSTDQGQGGGPRRRRLGEAVVVGVEREARGR